MIWDQIQAAKTRKRNLHLIFLDFTNAFDSAPHSLIWRMFDYFRVPGVVVNLVKAYFQDMLNTAGFTTTWQRLETAIMAGFTIFFTIIRASNWIVGGERQQTGIQLPPVRAHVDDLTLVTPTVP